MNLRINLKKVSLLLVVISSLLSVAYSASANTIVRSGQTVSVTEEQEVDGDFYVAAGTVNVSGVVTEDALVAGGQITINGTVNESAFLVGGNVDVHGPVGDDLRIIGGNVTIAEPVTGDVFVIGGSVDILSSASIGGDLLIYAGDVEINGSIGGEVLGAVNSLRIDSFIGDEVDVRVNMLVLGDKANLAANLNYDSYNQLDRSLNAVVSGEIVRNDPIVTVDPGSRFDFLVPSLMILFSALTWFLVSRKTLNNVVEKSTVKSPKPILVGFAVTFLVPVAILILIGSIIGSMVGLVLLAAYLLILLLATLSLPAMIGQMIINFFSKTKKDISLTSILIGVLVLALFSQLPLLGEVFTLALILVSVGGLVELLLASRREE